MLMHEEIVETDIAVDQRWPFLAAWNIAQQPAEHRAQRGLRNAGRIDVEIVKAADVGSGAVREALVPQPAVHRSDFAAELAQRRQRVQLRNDTREFLEQRV